MHVAAGNSIPGGNGCVMYMPDCLCSCGRAVGSMQAARSSHACGGSCRAGTTTADYGDRISNNSVATQQFADAGLHVWHSDTCPLLCRCCQRSCLPSRWRSRPTPSSCRPTRSSRSTPPRAQVHLFTVCIPKMQLKNIALPLRGSWILRDP